MRDRDITVGDGFRVGMGLFLFGVALVIVLAVVMVVCGVSLGVLLDAARLDAVTNR